MAGCDFGFVPPTVGGYCVGDGAATAPKNLGNSGFDDIAESAAKAASTTVKALGSAWMNLSSPDLTADSGPVALLRDSTLWFTTFTAVLCLLVAAGHLAWQRRGEPARQALQGLLNLVVVSSAGVATVNLLAVAGDKFSVWIIDRSTGCRQISATGDPVASCVAEFDKRTSAMLALGDTGSSFLVLVMAILVIAASVGQIALMIVRMAMLVILTGTLPLSAAASSTATGRVWFRRSVGWLLAFVLYKPAAAIVYAAAFSMTGQKQDNEVVSMVSGVVLIVLACFTLPALMRFAAPVVQAVTSGTGRTSGASGGAGSAAAVTGALSVPHLRGPAAGRSVSGAAVGPDGLGTTGARATPGAATGGQVRARGAEGAQGAPDGERTAGDPAWPAHPADPEDPGDTGETQPEHRWEATAPVLLPARQHTDDQQKEPRGSH
jgi:type IV secretion system protein TrbL